MPADIFALTERGVAQGGTAPAAARQTDAGDACARTRAEKGKLQESTAHIIIRVG